MHPMPCLRSQTAVIICLPPRSTPAVALANGPQPPRARWSFEFSQMFVQWKMNAASFVSSCRACPVWCPDRPPAAWRFALLAAMIERYPQIEWRQRPLDGYVSFVYGPVCVDRRFRGRGLLRGLYRTLLSAVADRFEIGVAFVAHERRRGHAHDGEHARVQANLVADDVGPAGKAGLPQSWRRGDVCLISRSYFNENFSRSARSLLPRSASK